MTEKFYSEKSNCYSCMYSALMQPILYFYWNPWLVNRFVLTSFISHLILRSALCCFSKRRKPLCNCLSGFLIYWICFLSCCAVLCNDKKRERDHSRFYCGLHRVAIYYYHRKHISETYLLMIPFIPLMCLTAAYMFSAIKKRSLLFLSVFAFLQNHFSISNTIWGITRRTTIG